MWYLVACLTLASILLIILRYREIKRDTTKYSRILGRPKRIYIFNNIRKDVSVEYFRKGKQVYYRFRDMKGNILTVDSRRVHLKESNKNKVKIYSAVKTYKLITLIFTREKIIKEDYYVVFYKDKLGEVTE